MKETELYQPVKSWLEEKGYQVRGEVMNCDIAAYGQDTLILVELKLRFNLELLLQSVERQKYADQVYVAIPNHLYDSRMQDIFRVLRRLGLGLLMVKTKTRPYTVREVIKPAEEIPINRRRADLEGRMKIIRELEGRPEDLNTGGSTGVVLYTAYKIAALQIAEYLNVNGARKASDVAAATGVERARHIMYTNPLGWFTHPDKGIYDITEKARKALAEYHGLTAPAAEPDEWLTDDADY